MRILIFGNSGSGKSSYARILAAQHALTHLDLDTIVWAPNQIAVQRDRQAVLRDLSQFTSQHENWVIEGCYGELIESALPLCTRLVFMNPGRDKCVQHNSKRPWEPEKYATPEEQDRMLENLIQWVISYYSRDDTWAYAYHRQLFDAFDGDKQELAELPAA